MTTAQYVEYVTDSLTGGGYISIQVKKKHIEQLVYDAMERVTPWYRETPLFETVTYTQANTTLGQRSSSGFINVSDLEKPIHIVEMLVPIEVHHAGDYVLEEISDLLGLPAGLWDSATVRNYAEWMNVRRMIKKSMGKEMGWRYIPGQEKIYVDDVSWNKTKVTVVYIPMPQVPSDITYGPAISWVKDWVEAKTKVSWGTVMSKFSGGATNFTLSGASLIASGELRMAQLLIELKTLQHSYSSFGRRQ